MCLTIPAKVLKIEKNRALIKSDIETKNIDTSLYPDLQAGDWVLYISDVVVKKIPASEAKEIVDLLKIRPGVPRQSISKRFTATIKKSKISPLSAEDITYLLNTKGAEMETLLQEADLVRRTNLKEFICIHGIIEFSNYCKNDCFYCGLRAQNKQIKRYRMSTKEIVQSAVEAAKKGYKLLVLQSGEDYSYSDEVLAKIIKEIKKRSKIFIFMSVGERGQSAYKKMKQAGASGVLLRFETSNSILFKKIHLHGKILNQRLQHLKFLKNLGFYIASGPLIGFPGQTTKDLANDLLLINKLKIPMISMGPFIPCPDTPFAKQKAGDPELNLKTIAVARLLMPGVRIPCTTALETLMSTPNKARARALNSGANALMFVLTPKKYRADYKIYPGRDNKLNELWEKHGLWRYEESFEMLEKRLNAEL